MQVKGGTASGQARTSAAKLSGGSAMLALELVGFDQCLSTAMQYVFGNAFVCKVGLHLPHQHYCPGHHNIGFQASFPSASPTRSQTLIFSTGSMATGIEVMSSL